MVSVGTHEQPFQRLLDAVAIAVERHPSNEWLIQYGTGRWSGRTVDAAPYLSASDMREGLAWADVLVSQASPGNVFGALEARTWPLVLGRQKALGEHVDDHQVHFARAMDGLRRATDVRDAALLPSLLDREALADAAARRSRARHAARTARRNEAVFREDVWAVVGGLL